MILFRSAMRAGLAGAVSLLLVGGAIAQDAATGDDVVYAIDSEAIPAAWRLVTGDASVVVAVVLGARVAVVARDGPELAHPGDARPGLAHVVAGHDFKFFAQNAAGSINISNSHFSTSEC